MTAEEKQALLHSRYGKKPQAPKKTTEERADVVQPRKIKYRPRATTVVPDKNPKKANIQQSKVAEMQPHLEERYIETASKLGINPNYQEVFGSANSTDPEVALQYQLVTDRNRQRDQIRQLINEGYEYEEDTSFWTSPDGKEMAHTQPRFRYTGKPDEAHPEFIMLQGGDNELYKGRPQWLADLDQTINQGVTTIPIEAPVAALQYAAQNPTVQKLVGTAAQKLAPLFGTTVSKAGPTMGQVVLNPANQFLGYIAGGEAMHGLGNLAFQAGGGEGDYMDYGYRQVFGNHYDPVSRFAFGFTDPALWPGWIHGFTGRGVQAAPWAMEADDVVSNTGKQLVRPYLLSRNINKAARAYDGTVGPEYFHSPDKWYRITSSPEIYGIREQGMNVTTKDLGDMPNSADQFRRFVIDRGLVPGTEQNEGYWIWPQRLRDAARNKRIAEEAGEVRPRKLFDLDENPSLFRKTGAAHGNRSQAAWQAPWEGTTTTTSEFPEYILEGSPLADLTIPYGRRRSSFVSLPIDEVPFGARVGFKTGEMPIEGLRAFRRLPNGRYQYEGPVIPDRRVQLEGWPYSSQRSNLSLYERPKSRLTAAERAGIPKGERNQPKSLNSHVQGDEAIKMFKEYGGVEIPEGSINGDQLRKYVAEARERYGIVGRLDITDEEIAQALYKQTLELGEGTAAVNAQGEPQLLFRGDTKRYPTLRPSISPIELASKSGTMDNSLGTLFLGEFPFSYQGADRYLGTYRVFNGRSSLQGSGTGSKVLFGNSAKSSVDDVYMSSFKLSYPMYSYTTPRGYKIAVSKLPASMMESGINDLNAFVVRTPAMRDATREISVLNDYLLVVGNKHGDYYGPKVKIVEDKYGFPLLVNEETGEVVGNGLAGDYGQRDQIAAHYESLLEKAEANNEGLLKSNVNSPLRDEHDQYSYFALPNFNIKGAKHILPYDLRIPRNWNNLNVYKSLIPLILGGTYILSKKKGGKIYYKPKCKTK